MKLISLSLCEWSGTDREWRVDGLTFGLFNLLVGRNAAGKTRVINVISNLGKMLSGQMNKPFGSGRFDVQLDEGGDVYRYTLEYEISGIENEELYKNDNNLLHRGPGNLGQIWAVEENKKIKFKTESNRIAVAAKRDALQHPFLEPIIEWARSLRHFEFGKDLGKDNLAVAVKTQVPTLDEFNTKQIVQLFDVGRKKFPEHFVDAIKTDMARIGYAIDDIKIEKPHNILIVEAPVIVQELVGISVKERDLSCMTDQPSMSQGMFRALSVITQLNYNILAKNKSCILVDDIGEGLDFERSCLLIKLLEEKTAASSIQVIMSTNDKFVMNSVSLDCWCVLVREGSVVRALSASNAREIFERFKKTGLANFDFLTTRFAEKKAS